MACIIPDPPPRSLLELVDAQLLAHAERDLLVLEHATLTYGEMGDLSIATANVLLDHGVGAGDVVMTRCNNGVAIVATWFACMRLGAVFTPLNTLLSRTPLSNVIVSAGGETLVCDADLVDEVTSLRSQLPRLKHILIAGGRGRAAEDFERAQARAGTSSVPAPPDAPEAPAKLMFTSGTTGDPKGVLWSRRAETLHGIFYGDELVRTGVGETTYSCLPLFHATCQGTLLGTLLHGGRIVIDRRFDPFRFWARTRETNAVFFPYVGTIISVLGARRRRPDDTDNPILRAMGSAAPADRWREFEDRFALKLEDVWGQTETASCWTRPAPGMARPGTVGRPTDRWEARVVRVEGGEAAVGDPGELWMRPGEAHVMFDRYHDDAGSPFDSDGWYRTGDLMSRDSDGDLVFHGRLRDAIRRRGEMIATSEIESAAAQDANVVEAVAVGIPADDGVEDEVLLCVVARGADPDARLLHSYLCEALPAFMVPRFIRFVDELPKTPTTRVRRHLLRATGRVGAWDARPRRGDEP